jgi:hypothetical protein
MLGAFMWLDDPELVERIAGFPHACVVITKQPRDQVHQARIDKLKPVLGRCPGFPADVLLRLGDLVLREDGKAPRRRPVLAGPNPVAAGIADDRIPEDRQPPRPDSAHQDAAARRAVVA